MKKFIAVFCKRNLFRPAVYKSESLANQKIAHLPLASHKIFDSQIEAEKFIFPKKIDYLKLRQFAQQKVKKGKLPSLPNNSQNSNSLQEIQNKQQQQQEQLQEQEQQLEDYIVDESKDYIRQFFISTKSKKGLQQKQPVKTKKKSIKKQEQLKRKSLFPDQPQRVQKKEEKVENNENSEQIQWLQKQNLKKVYFDIIGYQSKTNKFQKSKCSIQKKSNSIYYAFFDGCSKNNPGPSGAGYIVTNANGQKVFQNSINLGIKTNNQAEYMSFIFCLLDCKFNGIQKISVLGDSQLVVNGVTGKYKITNKNIKQMNNLAKQLIKQFSHFQIKHVQRQSNKDADKLSRLGLKKKCLKSQ